MSDNNANLIINAIINKENIAELQPYLAAIGPVFAENGGKPIVKYKATDQLAGVDGPEMIAIFQFPDATTIKTMVEGEAFKGLAELRARVFSKLNLTICEEM